MKQKGGFKAFVFTKAVNKESTLKLFQTFSIVNSNSNTSQGSILFFRLYLILLFFNAILVLLSLIY